MKRLGTALFFWMLAIGASAQGAFTLKGTTRGLPNGTRLYLQPIAGNSTNTRFDSAVVQQNRFEIKSSLSVPVQRVLLRTADDRQRKLFWLEAGTTTLVMTNYDLQEAELSGTPLANDQQKLAKAVRPFLRQQQALEEAAEKPDADHEKLAAAYDAAEQGEASANRQFIRQHPASFLSAFLLSVYSKQWGADTSRLLLAALHPALQQSEFGAEVSRYLSLVRKIAVDSMYADVAGPDTSGVQQKLSALQGKWVLLEFWASWCGPCRQANPALRQAYEALKGHSFEIFAVSLDEDAASWRKAIVKDQLPWIHVSQLKGFEDDAALTYSISAIPSNVLIGPHGKIVAIDVEPADLPSLVKGRQ